jgi:hypothetical protein
MATNKLTITGLDQLREDLKRLPLELVREAAVIVQAQGEQMAVEVTAAYPFVTGNLRDHVRVAIAVDAVSATARVTNTAKHAHLFEKGTKARQYTGHGPGKKMPAGWKAGKGTGAARPGKIFIPIAILRRRVMVAALAEIVTRAGLTVTTSA